MESASSIQKMQIEKKILQELSALQKLQQRAPKANEPVLVKRIAEGYKKALIVNFTEFTGPYTFKAFETYLFDQLELLKSKPGRSKSSTRSRRPPPSTDLVDIDIEKLASALKRMNEKLPFKLPSDPPEIKPEIPQEPPKTPPELDKNFFNIEKQMEQMNESNKGKVPKPNTKKCNLGDLKNGGKHSAARARARGEKSAYKGTPCSAYVGIGRRGNVPYKCLNFEISANPSLTNDPLIRKLMCEDERSFGFGGGGIKSFKIPC